MNLQSKQTVAQELQARTNRVIANLTKALVVASLLGIVVSYLQFRAAKESADAALSASEAAIQQVQIAQDANRLAGSTASLNEKNNRAILETGVANFHLDQRAWVAAVSITGVPEINKPFIVKVVSKNTGKTFAKGFRAVVAVQKGRKGKIDFDAIHGMRPESISLLAPNGEYTSETTLTGENSNPHQNNPDQALLNGINTGDVQIVVWGRMDYTDIFKVAHWSTFCFSLGTQKTWQSCKEHNDADNN